MNVSISQDVARVIPEVLSSGLMPSLCTITVPPEVFGPSGAPDPAAAYIPLAGHINIRCTAPPLAIGDKVQPTEAKTLAEILAKNMLHVLLGGYFPDIIPAYRALVDGVEYDIVGVESDSQKTQTRLAVQLVTI